MFRLGQPRRTWPTTQRPQQRRPLSCAAPGLRSPGLFVQICSASSQPDPRDAHGFAPTHIPLPPVLMFLPVPLRQAQFKSLFFFFFYLSLVCLQFSSPPLSLSPLCPSSLSIIPPPQRAGKTEEQHCPDASRQQSASRAFPSRPPPTKYFPLFRSIFTNESEIIPKVPAAKAKPFPSLFRIYLEVSSTYRN